MASFSDSTYWRARLNTIINLFNDERYHDCIAELELMLTYFELPPLYRIHAHALYAAALDDWYEAEDERARAEAVYTVTRMKWPPGENAKTDELLDHARHTLDDLAADMLEDRPDDWQEHMADMMESYIEAIATAQDSMKDDNATEESAERPSESASVPAGALDKHLDLKAPVATGEHNEHLNAAAPGTFGEPVEHVNGEHVKEEHVNGEHVKGEHVKGEHVNGEHFNGEHVDETQTGVDGGEVKQEDNGPKKTVEERLIESFEQAEAERKKKAQERASVRGMPGSLRRKKKNEQFNSGDKRAEETKSGLVSRAVRRLSNPFKSNTK